jgi:hypothetical protein
MQGYGVNAWKSDSLALACQELETGLSGIFKTPHSTSRTTMSTDEIDALLERYLHLLDQYTAVRTELGTLQSSVVPESRNNHLIYQP